MLYTNPAVLAQIAAVVEPGLESILVEVEGHEMRLAVEHGGTLTARGPRLQFREHVPWATSEFREHDQRHVLADLKRKIKRVWVFVTADAGSPEGKVREFDSWRAFVQWVGRPSDMLEKISWHECHPLNTYVPKFLNAAVDDLAEARKVSKRQLVVEALERYLNGGK